MHAQAHAHSHAVTGIFTRAHSHTHIHTRTQRHTRIHTSTRTFAHTFAGTHTHAGVCLALRGTPPLAVLMKNNWVRPPVPSPAIPQGDPGPDRQLALVQVSQTRPLTFLSAHSLGARGVGGEGRWSLGVCVSVCLCPCGTDVCVCASETVCEPVLRGTGRGHVPGLLTGTGPAWPAMCRSCHVPMALWAEGAGGAQPGWTTRIPGSLLGGGSPHPWLLPHLVGRGG